MTRQDIHTDGRESLLRTENTYPLRPSLEDAYRSSTDSEARLDSLDLDAEDKSRHAQRRKWPWVANQPPWSSGYTYADSEAKAHLKPQRRKGMRRWVPSRKTCLVVVLILALGLMTLVGSGALWVYKSAPVDGVRYVPLQTIVRELTESL